MQWTFAVGGSVSSADRASDIGAPNTLISDELVMSARPRHCPFDYNAVLHYRRLSAVA